MNLTRFDGSPDEAHTTVALLQGTANRVTELLPCECCILLTFERTREGMAAVCAPAGAQGWVDGARRLLPWSPGEQGKPAPAEVELPRPWGRVCRLVFVPLHHLGRELLGAMALGLSATTTLAENQLALAQGMADQAAALIVQAQYRERLRTVYALSEGFAHIRSEEELIAAALRILREAFHYGHVGLYLREGKALLSYGGDFTAPFASDEEMFRPFKRLPLDKGICGRVFLTGRSALVQDVREDPDYMEAHPSVRSELAAPITVGDEVWGLINVESPELGAFTQEDRELLDSLGRQIGVALSELRYRGLLKSREGLLRALSETADFDELLRYVLIRSLEHLAPKADLGGALVYDREQGTYKFRWAAGDPLQWLGEVEYPAEELRGVLSQNGPMLLADGRALLEEVEGAPRPHSAVLIPIEDPRSGEVVTYIYVGAVGGEGRLTAADADKLWGLHEEMTAVVLRARDLEEIRKLAFRDPLTGVYNRHFLGKLLEELRAQTAAARFPLALVLIDIDSFSEVNDRFGHLTGDRVLRGIAALLRRNVRAGDMVVRYGGDEFLILMPATPPEQAGAVLRRLAGLVTEWDPQLEGIRLSISFGIASWDPMEGTKFEEAVGAADASLYRQRRARG